MKCPECAQGKTVNCVGVALDFGSDEFVTCETALPQPVDQAEKGGA